MIEFYINSKNQSMIWMLLYHGYYYHWLILYKFPKGLYTRESALFVVRFNLLID